MRRAVAITLLVLGGALSTVEYLNFSGFCYSQRRYLSADELIAAAIKDNLKRHSSQSDNFRSKIYTSLEEFFRQNPDCCEVSRWNVPFGPPLLLRAFGVYSAIVDIVYRINDAGGVDNFYGSLTLVNSCGAILEVRGEPLAKNPKIRK
jgi:hypothetical protein